MSITSGPIKEAEQAVEQAADHIGASAKPLVLSFLDAVFEKLWQTRVVIDIGRREVPK